MDQAERLRNIIKVNNQVPRPTECAARVIAVTSGKGGVGKSNAAINLAVQLKKMGKRVIIFDADFGLANIEVMFGAMPKHTLADVIYERKDIREIITWGPMEIGFVSGGSGISGLSNLNGEQINYLVWNLAQLDFIADIIIVDTGAGIADTVLEFLVASGEVILVTTPEPTSITDSYSLLKALDMHPKFREQWTKIKVLSNRVLDDEEGRRLFSKLNMVVNRYLKLSIEFLGSVPQDDQLSRAVMQQNPVSIKNPSAKSSKAFERIAFRLNDRQEEQDVKRVGMSGFFASLMAGRKKL